MHSLFASHLHDYLSDCDVKLPDILLTHQASLQLVNTLVKSKCYVLVISVHWNEPSYTSAILWV